MFECGSFMSDVVLKKNYYLYKLLATPMGNCNSNLYYLMGISLCKAIHFLTRLLCSRANLFRVRVKRSILEVVSTILFITSRL